MPRIRQLSPEIANQIAAGEVIERPANAVKELVENALDAGARRIEVEVEEGGKKLIRVRDDGAGMSAQDAVLSLQRHATSKLQSAEELYAVQTLGFRGEALPSIAAVSRFELTTREAASEIGTRIAVEAGVVSDVAESGCAQGTEVVVRNLFFNTPARFKFLKSDQGEAARISEIVGHLALAYPHVAFRLRHNGNESLRAEGTGNALNAAVCVLGRDTARQLLPVAESATEAQSNEVRVTGFVGRPQLTKSNRNAQLFFVNGRAVKSRAMGHAVQAAYEGLLHGRERFPVVVLFVRVPANAVDVNVHPTKSEVRFAREWEVHHAVRVAVRETLVAAQLAPDWSFSNAESGRRNAELSGPFGHAPSAAQPPVSSLQPLDYRGYHQPVAPRGGDIAAFRAAQNTGQNGAQSNGAHGFNGQFNGGVYNGNSANGNVHNGQSTLPDMALPPSVEERRLSLRPLAQISNNAYILCEAPDGLYIVCQHRAHERILADRAIAQAEGKAVEAQRLVIPFTVEIGPRAAAAIEDNAVLLHDLGFEVEAFGAGAAGGSSVLVRAVPSLVANGDYETVFADLLDELIGGAGGQGLQERRRALLTMLSCKNAIKAGDALAPEQMRGLLDDLLTLPNPGICPHGQPILIKISTLELDKKFEREYASR